MARNIVKVMVGVLFVLAGFTSHGQDATSAGGISNTIDDSLSPSVGIMTGDNPVVSWTEYVGGGPAEIYCRAWDGTTWVELGNSGSGGGVSNNTGDSFVSSLAIYTDGNPVIAWDDSSNGGLWAIYLKRWNGANWIELDSSATTDGLSNSENLCLLPTVAVDSTGNIYVAHVEYTIDDYDGDSLADDMARWFRVSMWNGVSWTIVGSTPVNFNEPYAFIDNTSVFLWERPSVAIDPVDNRPVVAYLAYDGSDMEIFLRKWNGASWVGIGGSATAGGVSDNVGWSYAPTVTVDTGGNIPLAWHDDSPGTTTQIYLKRYDTASGTWSEYPAGSASGDGISLTASTSAFASINLNYLGVGVGWNTDVSGNWEIYLKTGDGTSWSEVDGSASGGGVSDNTGESSFPSLASDSYGNIYIAWNDNTEENFEIYLRKFDIVPPTLSNPNQYKFDETTLITDANTTDESGAVFKATVSDESGDVKIQVELKSVGTPFDETGLVESGFVASGSSASVTISGVVNGDYKWRVRAIDEAGNISAWVEYEQGAFEELDLVVESPTPVVSDLNQYKLDAVTIIPDASTTNESAIVFKATVFGGSGNIKIQVEVKPVGVTFDETVTAESGFVVAGSSASVSIFGIPDGQYKWRARAVDDVNNVSVWVEYEQAPNEELDFAVAAIIAGVIGGGAGGDVDCSSNISFKNPPLLILPVLAGVVILFFIRRLRKLGFLICLLIFTPSLFAQTTIYFNDFEAADADEGWVGLADPGVGGTAWYIGQPSTAPPGSAGTNNGTNSLWYNNGTNYVESDGTNEYRNRGCVTSPCIDITGVTTAQLLFACNWHTEDWDLIYDRRYLKIVSAETGKCVQVWQLYDDIEDALPGVSTPSTCAASGTWHQHTFDLDPAWGKIRVQFYFDTGDQLDNNFAGWFIDDLQVQITGTAPTQPPVQPTASAPYTCNFDTDVSDWNFAFVRSTINASIHILFSADSSPSIAPGSAYTPPNSLNYNNDTSYDDPGDSTLGFAISPLIDISSYSSAQLSFWCCYETDTTGTSTDNRYVAVIDSAGNMIRWWLLATSGAYDDTGEPSSEATCDNMLVWHQHTFPLDPAWGNVQILFYFTSINSTDNAFAGWFVDEFEVSGTGAGGGAGGGGGLPPFGPITGAGGGGDFGDCGGMIGYLYRHPPVLYLTMLGILACAIIVRKLIR